MDAARDTAGGGAARPGGSTGDEGAGAPAGAAFSIDAARRPAPPTGLRAALVVASTSSAGALRGRRLWGVLALVAMPLVAQAAFMVWSERGLAFSNFVRVMDEAYLRVIIPLATIFLGTASFGDEWEGGTAGYLIGAPVGRGAIVVGRWLAAIGRALALLLPAVVVLFLLCLLPFEGALAHYLPDLLWAMAGVTLVVAGYIAVFNLFGLLLRRSMMTALVYVLVFEAFIGNLPHGFALVSLSFHVRNLLWLATGHEGFEPNDFGIVDVEPTTALGSVSVLAIVTAVVLVLTTLVLRRKEFGGSSSAGEVAPG